MNKLILAMLYCLPLLAQTDHIYLNCLIKNPRKIRVLNVNSQSYRELPESPYPFEPSGNDVFILFVSTLAIDDPGPYLYATRQGPDQIYGYRRLPDGHLEPLPGSPTTPYVAPGTAGLGFVWLEKHPLLPVLYTSNAAPDTINIYRIEPDGRLTEFPESPFSVRHLASSPQALAFTPSGDIAFLNNFDTRGILALKLDDQGMFTGVEPAARVGNEPGRGVRVTRDGRYLYATNRIGTQIFGFSIEGTVLTPLPDFPIDIPFQTVWFAIQGDWLAAGSASTGHVAVWRILPDGNLQLGPGSPIEVHSDDLYYPAFSPDGRRLSFGGNTYLWLFDLAEDGRLTVSHHAPVIRGGICYGASMAPEIRGDPHALTFLTPPQPGDKRVILHGQANTPFYLLSDGQCHGPYTTDDDGFAEIDLPVGEDQTIHIRAYCDESQNIDTAHTVPALTSFGLSILVLVLMTIALHYRTRSMPRHRRN